MSQAELIDHDHNFKELISTFFMEFLELFLPEIAKTIDPNSIIFLEQEYLVDLVEGEKKIIDLLARVTRLGEETHFLIHFEAQATSRAEFNRRIFTYFARLHEQHIYDVFPIVIFSFDEPYRPEKDTYTVEFPNFKVLDFRFKSIQLNRLNWQSYVNSHNPVAVALMSKMRMAQRDRVKVKVECLRLLLTLQLNPAKAALISRFVNIYLPLDFKEERQFQTTVDKMDLREKEGIMRTMTSWEQKGMEKGRQEEARSMIFRQLGRRVGLVMGEESSTVWGAICDRINALSIEQLEALGEALLDFSGVSDLTGWLDMNG